MKTPLLAGATLALLAAVNLSPAMAQGSKLSGGDTWPGISQRVEPRASTHCRGNPALRVSVRLRQTREMEGSLGAGQVTGD
jgi:hypothetical protein